MTTDPTPNSHYRPPGWFTKNVFNRGMAFATRHGLSVWGSRVLRVKGRTTGEWREVPVNLLEHDNSHFLVAPRGTTQWVRNLRVAEEGELELGKRSQRFTATELGDGDKADVLRAYLRRWKAEVGVFFDGVGPDSSDAEIAAIAPKHPVFRIVLVS